MKWPWVSADRLAECENFWARIAEDNLRTADRANMHAAGYVDKLVEAVRENERLKAVNTPETFAGSVGVGFPMCRSDGMISLHLGTVHTLITPEEANRLAVLLYKASGVLT